MPDSTISRVLVLIIIALISACGGGSDNGTATRTLQSIEVTPPTAAIAGGVTQQFTAVGRYSDGTTSDITGTVTWSSSNTAVAMIAAQGLAEGLTDGTTTIRATSGTLSGTSQLQVTRAPKSLSVTPSGPAIVVGATLQLAATAGYDVGSPANVTSAVTWNSRTPGVATVTAGGLVNALSPGASTISASLGQLIGASVVQVNVTPGWVINVVRPISNGALTGSPLEVAVNVNAPAAEVQSVTATVAGRSLSLLYQASVLCSTSLAPPRPPECWRGALDLSGLARDYYALVLRATDVLGNSTTWTQEVLVDFGPGVQVTQPASLTIARPKLTIAASCTDDDARGCASITARVCRDIDPSSDCSQAVLSGTKMLDGVVDLAAYEGQSKSLTLLATDTSGQKTQVSVPILIESSSRLISIEEVPGVILDIDDSRLLYADRAGSSLFIRDRNSRGETLVYSNAGETVQIGSLTPVGAAFVMRPTPVPGQFPPSILRSSENGTVLDLGAVSVTPSEVLRVNGRYVLWLPGVNGSTLLRRDTVAQTTTTIATDAGSSDVAQSGNVAYGKVDGNIFLVTQAGTTALTNDTTRKNRQVRTDGSRVVYVKGGFNPSTDYQLILNSGGVEQELTDVETVSAGEDPPSPGSDYQIAPNAVAYGRRGPAGVRQIWRILGSNAPTQLTFGSTNSRLDALAMDGGLAYVSGGRRYLVSPSATASSEVSSALGRTVFINGTAYVVLGGTVFAAQ